MLRYIIKRLLMVLPVILGVSVLVFMIMHFAPGDPVANLIGETPHAAEDYENYRRYLGLDQPLYIQYFKFMERFFRGDLGLSIFTRSPVAQEILVRFPRTLSLSIAAILIALCMAIPLGIASAIKRGSLLDSLCMGTAVFGISVPAFWLGIILIYIFAFRMSLFPMSGIGGIEYLILPAFTLGIRSAAVIARLVRSSMLEVLGQDFVRTARAKGLSESTVILKHGLKNALIPVITAIGGQFGFLLGGSVLVETVFSYPGLGMFLVTGITGHDYPVVQGVLLFTTFTFVIIYIAVDIIVAYVNPRIQYE